MPIEGLLGRKLGMTQVFDSNGKIHAVTVVEAGPMVVTQVKTSSKDGYDAVQVGYGEKKKINKPMRGHLKGSGSNARLVKEFRSPAASEYSVGDKIGIELFTRRRPRARHRDVARTRILGWRAQAQLPRRAEDARSVGPPPRAWLDRFGHDAGTRAQGPEDGGPHGRRAGDSEEPARDREG